MTTNTKLRVILAIMTTCLTIPIWLYLLFRILVAIEATPVMWLLFWVYVPAAIIVRIIQSIIEK